MSTPEDLIFAIPNSRRVTAVEFVTDTIRTAILRGDLLGGSRLLQTEIASQLKVSTTPVREAMRELASEGLITLDSHRTGTVRSPTWDEMVEIVEIRRALEEVAIERAMSHVTDADRKYAVVLADELAEEQDLGSWVQKNSEFHSIFHRATRTRRLGHLLLTLEHAGGVFVAQAQRLHPEIRRKAVSEHYALLQAYDEKDVELALNIQLGHLNLPLEAFQSNSSSQPFALHNEKEVLGLS
jgi:DNA-binding GntR family transcriptional regulator